MATTDLDRFLSSLAAMFEPALAITEEIGSDGEAGYIPPYGKLFSPAECPGPQLPYLAQYIGVELPEGASEAEQRTLIQGHSGFSRGTRRALVSAIERIIGGGEPYLIQEREGFGGSEEAYSFVVIIKPGKATSPLYEAINGVIPGGLMYELVEVEGSWLAGGLSWEEIAAGIKWTTVKEGDY